MVLPSKWCYQAMVLPTKSYYQAMDYQALVLQSMVLPAKGITKY